MVAAAGGETQGGEGIEEMVVGALERRGAAVRGREVIT
jgi:hypothetical protein